jgi:hypothetical protein
MSLAVTTYSDSIAANILSGGLFSRDDVFTPTPLWMESQDVWQETVIPDFDLRFRGTLVNLTNSIDYRNVRLESLIAPGVSLILKLRNEPVENGESFQAKEVSLNLEVSEHGSQEHFMATSLYAAFALAGSVNISIPELNLDIGVRFKIPLSRISKLLQQRQAYFGLLVIERATGINFEIPQHIPGEDLNAIFFTYHAIVTREFEWVTNDVTILAPANEEYLSWMNDPRSTSVQEFHLDPQPASRTILGQTINLGQQTVAIEKGIIQNYEEAARKLSCLDGRIVPVIIRSLDRRGFYRTPDAPRLPVMPWDEEINKYIDIEDQLNERLAGRYNELAASTLSGLSAEEIEAVTSRPAFDENGYPLSY